MCVCVCVCVVVCVCVRDEMSKSEKTNSYVSFIFLFCRASVDLK